MEKIEKKKNSIVKREEIDRSDRIDFYQKMLCDFRYICKHNVVLKENIGVAIWYYITTNSYNKNLRYLYNKIVSIKDQISLFE